MHLHVTNPMVANVGRYRPLLYILLENDGRLTMHKLYQLLVLFYVRWARYTICVYVHKAINVILAIPLGTPFPFPSPPPSVLGCTCTYISGTDNK